MNQFLENLVKPDVGLELFNLTPLGLCEDVTASETSGAGRHRWRLCRPATLLMQGYLEQGAAALSSWVWSTTILLTR